MKRFALGCAIALLIGCSPDYQSGSTECNADGKCPGGYICGGASTTGAPDVCYSKAGAKNCTASDVYYCPAWGMNGCWSAKVACDTTVDCGNGTIAACSTEGYVPTCSSSGKCTAPAGLCTASASDAACTTCDKQSCCSQLTACAGQPACASLVSCLDPCASNDTACMSNCETSYPSGVATLTAWSRCLNSSCSASCN
jgi:hypothetical protein